MRLLERDDAGEIWLAEDFTDDEVPPYAILSHTWSSREVLLEDMLDGTGKNTLGYAKILFCGELARRDGLRYFWVDTCCVDRSSSAELQEMVNCLFRWYRDAETCYVYLDDVSAPTFGDADDESDQQQRLKAALGESRWFTRCWTLQELIAPASIEFFSREWLPLGNKTSLGGCLHEITGIPLKALQGSPLSEFTVSQRMSWIEKRDAAYAEDQVYALLGILGVHMPLRYGEGRESAFKRLWKELERPPESELSSASTAKHDALISHTERYGSPFPETLVRLRKLEKPPIVPLTLRASPDEYSKRELQTSHSYGGSLIDQKSLEYVTAFADDLHASLPSGLGRAEIERVSSCFDELLRDFACKARCEVSSPEHHDLIILIDKCRSLVIEELRQRYEAGVDQRAVSKPTGNAEMSIGDQASTLWKDVNNNPDKVGAQDHRSKGIPDGDKTVDTTQLTGPQTFREFIKHTLAYKWLLWQIMIADKLNCPGPFNAQKAIRDSILTSVVLLRLSDGGETPRVSIRYEPDWNLSAFHAEQQYPCPVDQVLEQAIVATGHGNDVQAATCLQYVSQTWGETGVRLLRILQQAVLDSVHGVSSFKDKRQQQNMSFDRSISASYMQGRFTVSAPRDPYSVAEVGELLAWLAAALRSPPSKQRAVLYWPMTRLKPSMVQSHILASSTSTAGAPVTGVCEIWSQVQTLDKSVSSSLAGACWMDLFQDVVVVGGYPIPRRPRAGSGLEVPVEIMVSLTNAKYLVDFCRRTFFKGFSTMLFVTEVSGSTMFWHLLYNGGGGYISYSDTRVPRIQHDKPSQILDEAALTTSRHILGWCQVVNCLAGTRDANYDIGWSKLRRPHSAFAFDKIAITAGKYVSVGTSLSIGIKDKAEHVSYDDDYLSTLQMISERHFVFYDVTDRRTWLLDGASALLHLMRAFINYSQTKSRLRGFFLFNEDELEEADGTRKGGDAAFWVLANESNQLLPLWRKAAAVTEEMTMKLGSRSEAVVKYQDAFFCVRDRVLQICRVLQQIIAHQDDVYSRDGVGARVKLTPRRQLEGFDFMDVATHQGTIWPQVHYIQSWGEGWVDFTRELHCVTLFGAGFGSLMEPMGNRCQLCMLNIPQGPDLLGITIADLLNIMGKRGGCDQSPRRIVEDIHWYVPDKLFEPCRCDSIHPARHDRVQVFLPATHPRLWDRSARSPPLAANGAILVGHSFKYPLRWGNRRAPEEGDPESPDENPSPPHDSGIGSSSPSESAEGSRSGRHLPSARSPLSRSDSREDGASRSAFYMHANRQFVHSENSSEREQEETIDREISVSMSETAAGPSRGSNDEVMGRSRPVGNLSGLWNSLRRKNRSES